MLWYNVICCYLPKFILWQMLLPIDCVIQHILWQVLYQYMVADVESYDFGRCYCPYLARWQILLPLIVIHDKSCVRLLWQMLLPLWQMVWPLDK